MKNSNDNQMAGLQKTWILYTDAWKAETIEEKKSLFDKALDKSCTYTDPLNSTVGWDALIEYMLDFHKQVPGGHFVITYFLAHNHQSICRWEMRDRAKTVLGEGISYGKFNPEGKLAAVTGFFETQ